jgi:single stranded DNA-binding protein
MSGENTWTGIGNLGKDAELSYVGSNQTPLCRFDIAISDKRNGKEYTTWVPIVAWATTAEIAAGYKKGDCVYVRGVFTNESWEKNGEKKSRNVITAFNVHRVMKERKRPGQEPSSEERPQSQPLPGKQNCPF